MKPYWLVRVLPAVALVLLFGFTNPIPQESCSYSGSYRPFASRPRIDTFQPGNEYAERREALGDSPKGRRLPQLRRIGYKKRPADVK